MTTWFITGTSSGFGRILTEQLLARGDRVAATLRHPGALDDLRAEYGDNLWVAALDVTDADQARKVVSAAWQALGAIDVVVNNAGFGLFAAVEEPSDEQIRQVLDTNLLGSIHVIRAALPHLRAQRHGRILQIASAGGQATYPSFSAYHAAKWGIEGFCQTVALEVASLGIGMTIVEPGATPTGFASAIATAPSMSAYEDTPAGEVQRTINSGSFVFPNDAAKVITAIIDMVDARDTPLRLPLGIDAYQDIRASLVARLAEHDGHREVALSVVS